MHANLQPIPTGLRPPAQGCEERATLGERIQMGTNPNGVVANPARVGRNRHGRNRVAVGNILRMLTQGSSFLATLGFGTESRWDSWDARLAMLVAPAEYRLDSSARRFYAPNNFPTFPFTFSSILMSGGQGRLKPSPGSFFVASMPSLLPMTVMRETARSR